MAAHATAAATVTARLSRAALVMSVTRGGRPPAPRTGRSSTREP